MGRGSENLPLARASRRSAAGALRGRRAPCLADYTGGRLSFGNEKAALLAFPLGRRRATARRSAKATHASAGGHSSSRAARDPTGFYASRTCMVIGLRLWRAAALRRVRLTTPGGDPACRRETIFPNGAAQAYRNIARHRLRHETRRQSARSRFARLRRHAQG